VVEMTPRHLEIGKFNDHNFNLCEFKMKYLFVEREHKDVVVKDMKHISYSRSRFVGGVIKDGTRRENTMLILQRRKKQTRRI
jgi:hypothetical protein